MVAFLIFLKCLNFFEDLRVCNLQFL